MNVLLSVCVCDLVAASLDERVSHHLYLAAVTGRDEVSNSTAL